MAVTKRRITPTERLLQASFLRDAAELSERRGLVIDRVELRAFRGGGTQTCDLKPAVGDVLVDRERVERELSDPLTEGERAVLELLARDGVVHHPDPLSLGAVDHVAGEQQLLRLEHPDLRRPHPERRRDTEGARRRMSELRVLGREGDVARAEQLPATREAVAVHLRHDRLAVGPHPQPAS